jgi:hypothetical protein
MASNFTQSPTLNLSGSTTEVTRQIRGFTGYLVVQGTFGGGTVYLDMSVDGGTTWLPYNSNLDPSGTQLQWSSDGYAKIDTPYCTLRFRLADTSTAHDIDIYIW